MKKSVHVATGIVKNHKDEFLIAKRREGTHLAGRWEFPGGKVEDNEPVLEALLREMHEELGIHIKLAIPFCTVNHYYADKDKHVMLDFHMVAEYSGEPFGKEGQEVCWTPRQELHTYDFPEANHEVLALLVKQQSSY